MELLEFKDQKPVPDIIYNYNESFNNIPVIIDNGIYKENQFQNIA